MGCCNQRRKSANRKSGSHGCTPCACFTLFCLFSWGIVLGVGGVLLGTYLSNPSIGFAEWTVPKLVNGTAVITPLPEGHVRFVLNTTIYPIVNNHAKFPVYLEADDLYFALVPLEYLVLCIRDTAAECDPRAYEFPTEFVVTDSDPDVVYVETTRTYAISVGIDARMSKQFGVDAELDCKKSKSVFLMMEVRRPVTVWKIGSINVRFKAAHNEEVAFFVPCG